MEYTREQTIQHFINAFQDKKRLYSAGCINWTGKTKDTGEYYTEVLADYLCRFVYEYKSGIACTPRGLHDKNKSYFTPGHKTPTINEKSGRAEEKIAIRIMQQQQISTPADKSFKEVGRIIDYQTPLNEHQADGLGKIDLLAYDDSKSVKFKPIVGRPVMRLLELKKPESTETLLRCVLEAFTYYKTACLPKLIHDFKKAGIINPDGYDDFYIDSKRVIVRACPLIFAGSNPDKELSEMLKGERMHLEKLFKCLGISEVFYIERTGGNKESNYTYCIKDHVEIF